MDSSRNVASALNSLDDIAMHGAHPSIAAWVVGLPSSILLPSDLTGKGTGDIATRGTGFPLYNHWPHWTSTTHQKMYYRWLERAYRGGLRLMVELAVTNSALCIVAGNSAEDCNDSMASVDA